MNRVIPAIFWTKYLSYSMTLNDLKWSQMSSSNPKKEIGEHFQLMGDHTKFPRWITHIVFGESFMNDTSKLP